ncbi:1466_t:CDS:2 [Gigaspora rosea]|nr:1466_t:CDS:2 [Gigaspora rosea]
MEDMKKTVKPPQKLLKGQPTDATEEINVFRVIAQKNLPKTQTKRWKSPIKLWQEATWSGQIDYNLELPGKDESQLMDIDEVYLIDISQWGEHVSDVEFDSEEEDWSVGHTYYPNLSPNSWSATSIGSHIDI